MDVLLWPALALFLASDLAGLITGAQTMISGGEFMKAKLMVDRRGVSLESWMSSRPRLEHLPFTEDIHEQVMTTCGVTLVQALDTLEG